VLGLRVWPENDFAPYVSVWHRTPEGDWSMFSDGPPLEAMCQRYWGPAVREAQLARTHLSWTGPNELRVEMESWLLVWTVSMATPPFLRVMNAVSDSLPLWSWKPVSLLRIFVVRRGCSRAQDTSFVDYFGWPPMAESQGTSFEGHVF